MKVLSDPVTVNEEQSGGKPLHKNVRRCSFVKIHKPGDLLKDRIVDHRVGERRQTICLQEDLPYIKCLSQRGPRYQGDPSFLGGVLEE